MLRFFLAILLLSSSAVVADTVRYNNVRFGTSAVLPADFYALEAPTNGDGRTFQHPRFRGTISVYGAYNHTGSRLGDYRRFLKTSYLQEGLEITYEAGKKGWFVLSGWDQDQIFYIRVEGCTGGPLHHMHFQYPGEDKLTWAPIIETFAKTLDGPCR